MRGIATALYGLQVIRPAELATYKIKGVRIDRGLHQAGAAPPFPIDERLRLGTSSWVDMALWARGPEIPELLPFYNGESGEIPSAGKVLLGWRKFPGPGALTFARMQSMTSSTLALGPITARSENPV